MQNKIRSALKVLKDGWSSDTLHGLVGLLSSPIEGIAQAARAELLDVLRDRPEQVREYWQALLQMPVTQTSRARALRFAQKDIETATLRYVADEDAAVTTSTLLSWIQSASSSLHAVIDTDYAWVLLAKVGAPIRSFAMAWLECNPGLHFLIVNASGSREETLQKTVKLFAQCVHFFPPASPHLDEEPQWEEAGAAFPKPGAPVLGSFVEEAESGKTSMCESAVGSQHDSAAANRTEVRMSPNAHDTGELSAQPMDHLYAHAQIKAEPRDKQLIAEWLVDSEHFPLETGAGVVVDAGSTALCVWQRIVDRLRNGSLKNIEVFTDSLQVLTQWLVDQSYKEVREIRLRMLGYIPDAAHLALYYPPGGKPKLDSKSFRPTNVYIGTSGIEFDERDGILLGYHGGDAEMEFKQMLFQCAARRRIILATPRKIGRTGGRVFELLGIPQMNTRAPIYLVTTKPPENPEDPARKSEEAIQLDRAKKTFESERIQRRIRRKGLQFHFVVLSRDESGQPMIADHLICARRGG